jgi:ADP-ribosyl-[dinitrogen reductase] hydrolase
MKTKTPDLRDRFRGALIGLAVGDAIGATNEFKRRKDCDVRDMVGGGPWRLRPGDYTDDTAMAFALADSLVECDGFDPKDVMTRWRDWWQEGKYAGTHGRGCFDIGTTTRLALGDFEASGKVWQGRGNYYSAANGCLMRFASVALYAFPLERSKRLELYADSARLTHGSPLCVEATQLFGEAMHAALGGAGGIVTPDFVTAPELRSMIDRQAWFDDADTRIHSTGYVIDTLEAAFWASRVRPADLSADRGPFAAGILRAANLGDDADTVAAVAGQLLGASLGWSSIPLRWRATLDRHDELLALADALYDRVDDTAEYPVPAELSESGA